MSDLKAPFPYFGGKRSVAADVWKRLGRPTQYIEPFCGSAAMLLAAPRREHSRKPDDIHTRVEALTGGPYLELFARQARPNWDAWGAETDKFAPAQVAA